MGCLQPTELTILFVGKDRNLKEIFFPENLTVEKEYDDTIRKSREINGKKIELEFQDFKFDSLEPEQSESKIPSVIIYLCDTEMKKSFEEIMENKLQVDQIFPGIQKVIMGFKIYTHSKAVEENEIVELAKNINAYHYYITDRSQINDCFDDIIVKVLSKKENDAEIEGKECC